MNTYKFTFHSGQSFIAEDKRNLQKLCADLCSVGFIIVAKKGSGYAPHDAEVAVFERAVLRIEPTLL